MAALMGSRRQSCVLCTTEDTKDITINVRACCEWVLMCSKVQEEANSGNVNFSSSFEIHLLIPPSVKEIRKIDGGKK
jgi:hypothetical protein